MRRLFLRFLLTFLVLSGSMLVAQSVTPKPVSLTPDRVLDAYEAAIRKAGSPDPICYHIGYRRYFDGSPAGAYWKIEGYYLEDGRFKERSQHDAWISQRGFDGKRFWFTSNDNPQGIRPNEFEKLVETKETSASMPVRYGMDFTPPSKNWRKAFSKLEILGRSKVDGLEVIVIHGITRGGRSMNFYYDSKDFLLRRADIVADIHKGTGEKGGYVVSRYFRKYSERGGWMIPGEIYNVAPDYTITMILFEFEINPQISEETFEHKN